MWEREMWQADSKNHIVMNYVVDPFGGIWTGYDIRCSIEREFAWLQRQVFPMWDKSDPRVKGK